MAKTVNRSGKDQSYDIETLQYPKELGLAGNNHMVMFFINVPSHSKIGKIYKGRTYDIQKTDRVSGTVSAAAQNAGVSKVGPIDIAPGYVQLKSAIAIYMPNSWSESYSAQYEEIKPANILNLMAEEAAKSGGQALDKLVSFGKNLGIQVAQTIMSNAIGQGGERIAGKLVNPNAEQSFTGMAFREFSFDFLMAPKSRDEADNVIRIIDMFRYHMHPERSIAQYLIFPSEFEISFYSGDGENRFIGGLSTCALENMIVNYTPNNVWSSFGANAPEYVGFPTSVHVQLQFKELEPLTRDRIEDMKNSPYTNNMHRRNESESEIGDETVTEDPRAGPGTVEAISRGDNDPQSSSMNGGA